MRFGNYNDEKDVSTGYHLLPSDSYIDYITENVGITATLMATGSGIYYLFRNRDNTALRTRFVNSLKHAPRVAAMVAACSFVSTSVECSLVTLRGKGDYINTMAGDSVFFSLVAARFGGPPFAAGLIGGPALNAVNDASLDLMKRLGMGKKK